MRPKRPVLFAVVLSLALHAALLWTTAHRPLARSGGSAPLHVTLEFRAAPAASIKDAPAADQQTDALLPPKREPADVVSASEQSPDAARTQSTPTPGAVYYTPDQLSAKPVFLRDEGAPTPQFIPDVMPLPVLATVFINESGTVDEVHLGESFLSSTAKDFIVSSFKSMQFTPGMLGELPVKSQLTTEVRLNPALPVQ